MIFYIILSVILLACLCYYLYNRYIKVDTKRFIPNNEFVKESALPGELILFYTTWCPHCTNTIEEFRKYKEKYSLEYKMNFSTIDCDLFEAEASMYNIDSYPTIILKQGETKYVYDSNFSIETMDKFINTIMSGQ